MRQYLEVVDLGTHVTVTLAAGDFPSEFVAIIGMTMVADSLLTQTTVPFVFTKARPVVDVVTHVQGVTDPQPEACNVAFVPS